MFLLRPLSSTAALAGLLFTLTVSLQAQDKTEATGVYEAIQAGRLDEAIRDANRILAADPANDTVLALRANACQRRGEENFRKGHIVKSIADFDVFLKQFPERKPYHWQRGISLYYADRFADGQKQFEIHQDVNSQDVENAVWHFLCYSKVDGQNVAGARANFIPITRDTRVPMKEVHALFAGTGSEQAVLEAAGATPADRRENALCYAHLYLGLYHEALGDAEKSRTHIRKAAVDHAQNHYMGDVAKVHLKLRSREK